jgi:hypothetical protein
MPWHMLMTFSVPAVVLLILSGQHKCYCLWKVFGLFDSIGTVVTCLFVLLEYSSHCFGTTKCCLIGLSLLSPACASFECGDCFGHYNITNMSTMLDSVTTKSSSNSVLFGPAESASLWNLLEMQIIKPHLRSAKLKMLGEGCNPSGSSNAY